jgi:hypothetical protein
MNGRKHHAVVIRIVFGIPQCNSVMIDYDSRFVLG